MCPREPAPAGHIAEVFLSIQGEGILVGVAQIFVRMAGCSRRCVYCDSPEARSRVARCVLNGPEGERYVDNPVDAAPIVAHVRALGEAHPGVHSVSITGGEPLEQPVFLHRLLPRLRSIGQPIYLETNGLEERACGEIAPLVDIVSLDVKLPSLCGGGDHFAVYRRVLPLFAERNCFVKIVVTDGVAEDEVERAARLVAGIDDSIPFVIQPAHPAGGIGPPRGETLIRFSAAAAAHLCDVRVIPQCHHVLGVS